MCIAVLTVFFILIISGATLIKGGKLALLHRISLARMARRSVELQK